MYSLRAFARDLGVSPSRLCEVMTSKQRLSRETGEVVSRFGQPGRMAGQFKWVHNIAIDSKGNLFTAEVGTGRRVQMFERQR